MRKPEPRGRQRIARLFQKDRTGAGFAWAGRTPRPRRRTGGAEAHDRHVPAVQPHWRPKPTGEETMTKTTTVVGVFHDRARAEEAAHALRQAGYRDNQMSVLRKGEKDEHTKA